MSQTLAQQKKKKKTLEQQIPKEFREDCKAFSIDFDKLQPKVDKVFDKWIGKENPKTKQPYTEKTVAKWIRFMMKEAGYSYFTIWNILKENHPDVIQKGHKSFRKSKTSDVTTEEEQDEELEQQYGKFENVISDPKQYLIEDLPKYPRPTLLKIVQWMDQKIGRMLGEMLALENENTELKQRLKEKEGKTK